MYYLTEAAKDMHFTKTAERLYISQQTLSNHIKSLEQHFGVALFNRKPGISLTCAGEHVLEFARNFIKESTNLQHTLYDIGNQEAGLLRIGASTPRANSFLPQILPEFSRRYPKVEIRLTDSISSKLEQMLEIGDLDFAVVLSEKTSESNYYHLFDDTVCLCVSDELLKRYYGAESETLKKKAAKGAEVQNFARLPFCLPSNRLGDNLKKCFANANCNVNTYLTSTYSIIPLSACTQGLAACFLTELNLFSQKKYIPEDINVFPIVVDGKPLVQKLALIHHKDSYLSKYEKYFLELTFRFFKDMKHLGITGQ